MPHVHQLPPLRVRTLCDEIHYNPTVRNETPNDGTGAHRRNLSELLKYYDLFENLVVRDILRGRQARDIISQADLALRTGMFRASGQPPSY